MLHDAVLLYMLPHAAYVPGTRFVMHDQAIATTDHNVGRV